MGNCCGEERTKLTDLSYIKSIDVYFKTILENLARVQKMVNDFSTQLKDKNNLKRNVEYTNIDKSSFISYEIEQFYILLGNTLLKLKIMMENYSHYKKEENLEENKRPSVIAGGSSAFQIDFSQKEFNLSTAVPYLERVLDTENCAEKNIKTLELLNKEMANSLFI